MDGCDANFLDVVVAHNTRMCIYMSRHQKFNTRRHFFWMSSQNPSYRGTLASLYCRDIYIAYILYSSNRVLYVQNIPIYRKKLCAGYIALFVHYSKYPTESKECEGQREEGRKVERELTRFFVIDIFARGALGNLGWITCRRTHTHTHALMAKSRWPCTHTRMGYSQVFAVYECA